MANVAVAKPEASTNQNVPAQQGSVYQLGFNPGDATLTREGDNLKFTFNDGSATTIENFYTVHSSEDMPSFETDGAQVSGEAFFQALNEPDLMPAAGPAAGAGAAAAAAAGRGGRYNEYGNSDLNGGLDHLTRLDYNSDRAFDWEPGDWITAPDYDPYGGYANIPVAGAEPAAPAAAGVVPPAFNPATPGYTPAAPAAPVAPGAPAAPAAPVAPVTPPAAVVTPEPPAEIPPAAVVSPEPPVETPPANTTPGVVVPPTDSSSDGPGTPSGNVPGQPGEPGRPGKPNDPDNPDNPPDSGDPNDPGSSSFIHAGGSTIVVDEGALPGGTGQHTYHGIAGSGTVILDVKGEGDGRAVFTFTDQNGNTVTFDEMGAIPVSGASVAPTEHVILKVGNVEIDIKGASYDSATGKWTVEYDYRLVESAGHGLPGTETDDIVSYGYGNAITVTVTDFSGDVAQGAITVEIHDDVPVLTVVDPDDPNASTLTGQFVTNFGADGMNEEMPFKVDGKEGARDGDSWVFEVEGGTLVITPDGGNTWNYEFRPEGDMPAGSRDFVITAIDGDKDETTGIVTVRNEKPSITPNEPKDPEDPEDPDKPTDEDPKDPDDPDNPDNPDNPPVSVDADGMHIKVDEAALAASKGEQGAGHTHHGFEGSASVTVTLRGGEGGVVEIGNGYTITIAKGENGEWTATPSGDNTVNTGNVTFTFGNAVSSNPETGEWTISFDYKLDDNTGHGAPGTETDNIIFDNSIPLKVTDSVGGNTAESQITVEIHDDVPVLTVVEPEDPSASTLTGQFTTSFGADGMNEEMPFKVDGKEGARDGDSWVFEVEGGTLVITPDEGNVWNYEFRPEGEMPEGSRDFVITAIDGDKDETTGIVTVRNEKPSITPNEPKDPEDPEDPKDPDDPDNPVNPGVSVDVDGMHIAVDEAALAASKGEEGAGHTDHGYKGSASITVELKGGEGGVVEIGNGYTITIAKDENGEWTATPSGDNTVNTGNVTFTFGNAISSNPETGEWTISFDYKLDDNAGHGEPGSATDNIIFDNSIPLKVTDSVGGNTAESQITVEIHDDVPVLTVVEPEDPSASTLTGQFTTSFGADGMNEEMPFKVDGKEGAKDGDAWVFEVEGGTLVISPDEGNTWNYEFRPEGEMPEGSRDFVITAIDGDKDETTGIVTVRNEKPSITPNEPKDPEDPEDPKDPDDPDNPVNPGVSVDVDGMHIAVDEAALAASKGEEGAGHTDHGYKGSASVTVELKGGEGGVVEIGNGYAITIAKDENGEWTATPSGDNTVNTGNVTFTFGNAVSSNPETGQWTISFDYKLDDNAGHGEPGSATDNIIFDNSIPLKVTDSVGGNTAESQITVEIHDDVPVLTVVEPEDPSASTLTGQFTTSFGADGMNEEMPFKIDGKEGTKDGNSWVFEVEDGTLVISPDEGNTWNYEFRPEGEMPEGSRDFVITAIDGDKDETTGIVTVRNEKPGITPNDPENPGDDPAITVDVNGMHIKVDEAALAGSDNGAHSSHGYKGSASITVELKGSEGGEVVIGDGYKIAITRGEDGKWIATPSGNGALHAGAMIFEFGNATSTDPDSGKWTINFKYELESNVEHGKPGSATDEIKAGGVEIPIKVTDSIGGDTAESKITFEIHDDVPVLGATGGGELTASESATGNITHSFGADLPADQIITITLNGTDYQYKVGETLTIKGEYGDLTINEDGSYVYNTADKLNTGSEQFELTIVDSDGDEATADLGFTVKGDIPITVTVTTPDDDKVEGDHPGGGKPPYVEDSTVLGGDPETPSHDIVIADIAGADAQHGNSYNVAFILDCSSSMRPSSPDKVGQAGYHTEDYLELAKTQVAQVINQLQHATESANAGEVNVLLMGFHGVVTEYVSVTLRAGDDAYKVLLDAVTGLTDSTTGKWNNKWGDSGAWDNPFITTNYELAFSYAKDWFEQNSGNGYENKTYFLTDGTPTLHVQNTPLTFIKPQFDTTWKNPFQVEEVDWSKYELGKEFVANDGWGHVLYVSQEGVLYSDARYTHPVTLMNVGGASDTLNKFPAPVVMMKGENGEYRPYATAGSMYHNASSALKGLENDEAHSAWNKLDQVSDVTAIGIGGHVDNLDNYDSSGESLNNLDVSQIADKILGSMTFHEPGADMVDGGEGRDVLFGDRIVEDLGDEAAQANVDALKEAAGVDRDANAQEFLQALIDNHNKVAEKLDEIDAKGGADTLIGGKDSDILYGMGGNDVLIGDEGAGATAIIGKDGANVRGASAGKLEQIANDLETKDGADPARAGDDILYGGKGDDILYGGGGDDVLVGGQGADYLFGGSGNDILFHDTDDEFISGGSGVDMLVVKENVTLASVDASDKLSGIEMLLKASSDKQFTELQAASYAALGIAIADGKVTLDMSVWQPAGDTATTSTFEYTGTDSKFSGLTLEVRDECLVTPDSGVVANSLLDEMIEMDANGTLHGEFEYDRLADAHKPLMQVNGEDTIHGGYQGILSEAGDQEIQFGNNAVTAINRSDIYVEGGMGIDIVVTADDLSLEAMLAQGEAEPDPDAEMPAARDVDVLVKGEGLEEVSSAEELAAYGITFSENGAGIELSGDWKLDSIDPDSGVATFVNESTGLTLETTLMQLPAAEEAESEVAEAALDQDIVPPSEDDADVQASADATEDEEELVAADEAEESALEEEADLLAENSEAENPDSEIEDGLKTDSESEDTLVAEAEEEEAEVETAETAEADGKPITLVTEAEYKRLEEEKEKSEEAEQQRAEADADPATQDVATADIPESPTVETPDLAETASNAMIVNSDSGNA